MTFRNVLPSQYQRLHAHKLLNSLQKKGLGKVKEDQEAKGNETAHDYTIPPFLVAYPANQAVDTRHLAGRSDYATVDAGKRFSLDAELLVDGICLREHSVRHVVTVVYATALV
jgi:hypothetical protein